MTKEIITNLKALTTLMNAQQGIVKDLQKDDKTNLQILIGLHSIYSLLLEIKIIVEVDLKRITDVYSDEDSI